MKKEELLKRLESHQPDILGMPNTREHAVILPVIEKAEDLHILFEVRSQRMRRQPGEVCFPGGKIDSGETPQEAALREMHEEMGSIRTRCHLYGNLAWSRPHLALNYMFLLAFCHRI